VRPADPVAARAIATLLAESDEPATPEQIAWAVRKTLEESAADRPLVCVLDDIHWAEPGLLDLVEHVADYSRGASILLLCVARPELLERRPGWAGGKLNATTLLLEPLSEEQTDELIDRLGSVDQDLRIRIRSAAEGNPLFVEEMLAMIRDSGEGAVIVPPTIQALLASRLDQLDAPDRTVLQRGAVEGHVFHRGAVEALAPDEEQVSQRLLELVRKELVRPDQPQIPGQDAYRFRHLLIRDAAYDALPKTVRAEVHERFAEWLERHGATLAEQDEIVGYHLEQACRYRRELGRDDQVGELAMAARRRLLAAGRHARVRDDVAAAVKLLERAAQVAPDGPLEIELEFAHAEALFEAGRAADAIDIARALAIRGADESHRVAELTGRILEASWATHLDPEGAADRLEALIVEALPELEAAGDDLALYIAEHARGVIANMRGRAQDWHVQHYSQKGNIVSRDCALDRLAELARIRRTPPQSPPPDGRPRQSSSPSPGLKLPRADDRILVGMGIPGLEVGHHHHVLCEASRDRECLGERPLQEVPGVEGRANNNVPVVELSGHQAAAVAPVEQAVASPLGDPFELTGETAHVRELHRCILAPMTTWARAYPSSRAR
jgi:tetratricopeptide (TPR) repeat protein